MDQDRFCFPLQYSILTCPTLFKAVPGARRS